MDGLLQPRIGGLYQGVSRQSNLQRSPSQMQELDNFLPSVDYAGFVDRIGTKLISGLTGIYANDGHHFFRTTDGQRWVLLRTTGFGGFEVRSLADGTAATVNYGSYVQNYIASEVAGLRFLTISDTTLIVNTNVTTLASEAPVPALTTIYLVVEKVSTAAQSWTATSSVGTAAWTLPANSSVSRDFVSLGLSNNIGTNMPGLAAFRVAGNVIRVTGPADIIASFTFSNDWDTTAALLIKGRVTAITDLPPTFESGIPVLVDLGAGDAKSAYYVEYDGVKNAWIECSYLPYQATTADLNLGTMPARLHQVGPSSFELVPCPWVSRKTGDHDSNPLPGFVNQPIKALAQWKGRLWFAAGDAVYSSQPDDLFNFFRQSAREVLPSDPVSLQIETPDVSNIEWLVAFRSKLMVLCDNAQLEIPGDNPVTPTNAVIGTATKYQLSADCEPSVVGEALYYTGPAAGRSLLWEYQYEQQTDNNTAEDLGKHVPGYVPGRVKRIRGSAQSGRIYLWTDSDPSRLYVQTSYWKDGQRAQNAWSKLTFGGIDSLQAHWVYEDTLYLVGSSVNQTCLLSVPVESTLGETMATDFRLDFTSKVQIGWNATRQRSEFTYPVGYSTKPELVVLVDQGDGWYREYPVTTVWDGTQFLGWIEPNLGANIPGFLGVRFTRSATFSPFYPTVNDKTTPLGRLQIAKVNVDTMVSCDFTATVTRPDRIPMVTPVSPRVVASVPTPLISHDKSFKVPFNAKGDVGSFTISTTSTGPLCVTGLTLEGRYTNPTAS